ncbi:MAG: DUF2442 domain-containing protein [Geoalkalibacter sp.]|uniref:DUF2442 domain-containing protein n=1 Tax=Geoalkalibacter sp. TaxID=3041440 RepID=UPI003D0F8C70
METLLDVVRVKAKPEYMLELEFENGEVRLFDFAPYLEKKPFDQLKDTTSFYGAHVNYGTVCWPGDLDIAPETLYDGSVPIADKNRINTSNVESA